MGMHRTNRIAKIVTKRPLKDRSSNFAYWQSQPYAARIEALEEIRREYHLWKYGAEPKFQKIYSIVKR